MRDSVDYVRAQEEAAHAQRNAAAEEMLADRVARSRYWAQVVAAAAPPVTRRPTARPAPRLAPPVSVGCDLCVLFGPDECPACQD